MSIELSFFSDVLTIMSRNARDMTKSWSFLRHSLIMLKGLFAEEVDYHVSGLDIDCFLSTIKISGEIIRNGLKLAPEDWSS